ncbi:hypothetical protein [Flavobacterium aestivum]|uniref:hypothetical protein n=1 Tax=Flavobacterium aestivum TaxID=3003257 RepID=UPI002482FCD2|nr:hypothetical protein [Flavobacterium aestivum]
MKKAILISFLFVILVSSRGVKPEVVRSFCYWKTDHYTNSAEDSLAKKMQVKHLYVRFFDVDWNPYASEPQPVATTRSLNWDMEQFEITPSIFVTNEVMLLSSKKQLDSLAMRIEKRVENVLEGYKKEQAHAKAYEMSQKIYDSGSQDHKVWPNTDSIEKIVVGKIKINCKEILIDCDWSEKSKKNYFYLLQRLKTSFPQYSLSATVRLWQYKYREKAGIPPVDKGLLMCYNLTSPTDHTTENSIGTSKEVEDYITKGGYALPLDLALPLYSWSVVFRGNQFKGILSDYDGFVKDTIRFKKVSATRYLFQDDILIGDTYFRNGDEIRIEKISDAEIRKMIGVLKSKITITDQTKVTFFSFDKKYINDYGTENISNYYSLF